MNSGGDVNPMTIELCPVCGYRLGFPPWKGESASDEICPCCYIQFGFDDYAGGDAEGRSAVYLAWRNRWLAEGLKWRSRQKAPPHWDPVLQLATIGVQIGEMS